MDRNKAVEKFVQILMGKLRSGENHLVIANKLADVIYPGEPTTVPEWMGIDVIIARDVGKDAMQSILDKEAKIRKVTQAYEQYMAFNPLDWSKLERLQKFLLTKSVEEIKTFAAWSRKEYSTLTPPKARQYPQLVIDCWNLAFEKPTAENNTKSAIQEAIHGRTN